MPFYIIAGGQCYTCRYSLSDVIISLVCIVMISNCMVFECFVCGDEANFVIKDATCPDKCLTSECDEIMFFKKCL